MCASWCLVIFDLSKKWLAKTFETLIKQFRCFCEHPYPTILAIFSQSDVKMSSVFFPLLASCLMVSECSYRWCVVSVFGICLCCLCLSINTCSVYCAMTNHFCIIVLFEYSCDMDHESDVKFKKSSICQFWQYDSATAQHRNIYIRTWSLLVLYIYIRLFHLCMCFKSYNFLLFTAEPRIGTCNISAAGTAGCGVNKIIQQENTQFCLQIRMQSFREGWLTSLLCL